MSSSWRLPRRVGSRIEPPAWVRSFELERWEEPDELERRMVDGCGGSLPEEIHRWHAERRWHLARNDWYRAHPEADNRLEEMRSRIRARRVRPDVF